MVKFLPLSQPLGFQIIKRSKVSFGQITDLSFIIKKKELGGFSTDKGVFDLCFQTIIFSF